MGILGGTFNPPHLGHAALAQHALEELALDSVALMPACSAPHKPLALDPGSAHRLRMCRLLVDHTSGLSVCALEIERGGRSYTVETLDAIHATDPEAELTFVLGADVALTLPGWREPARVLELCELAVAARKGSSRERVLEALAAIEPEGRRGGVRFLEMSPLDISSSSVRLRAASGQPIEALVGEAVAGYISEHGLYRPSAGAGG
jgi:nicotinate-nucleotide adenylyltransferase